MIEELRVDKEGNVLESSSDTGMNSGDGWAAYHHKSHAANTFYQSNFKDALVFSFDGGGDDGWFLGYHFDTFGLIEIDQAEAIDEFKRVKKELIIIKPMEHITI